MRDKAEKYIYQEQWEDYKDSKVSKLVFSIFCLIVFIGILIIAPNYPEFGKSLKIFFPIIFVIGILIGIYKLILKKGWKCPHCKELFSTERYYLGERNDICQNCDLPIYFGSSYFLDYWGKEKGREFIKQFGEDKL